MQKDARGREETKVIHSMHRRRRRQRIKDFNRLQEVEVGGATAAARNVAQLDLLWKHCEDR